MPDFGLTGTAVSCVAAKRTLYFTLVNGTANTAYTYDTGSATAPLSFCSNYQSGPLSKVNDITELAMAAQTSVSTSLAVVINRNLMKTVFRQISCVSASSTLTDAESSFLSSMTGKRFILFGADVGGIGTVLIQGTLTYVSAGQMTMSVPAQISLSDCLLFIGDFAEVRTGFSASRHLPNFHPYMAEVWSHQVAVWFKATGDVGNLLGVDVLGNSYSSARAL